MIICYFLVLSWNVCKLNMVQVSKGPCSSSVKWKCGISNFQGKALVPHSSILARRIPWMEEPGGLQSMGSLGVGHDWETSLSLFTFMHWRRKWQPTPVFLPGESQGRGAWWAAVYGVAQNWTRLKWLSSSSNMLELRAAYIPLAFLHSVWSAQTFATSCT